MTVIISNPKKLGGKTVFKGMRVPVSNLFDYLLADDTIKDFLDNFPTVNLSQVRYVLKGAVQQVSQ